ncbi:MAG: M20/M25/M40 family metallo-hydrolase [Armatimonadetes bacterium]|nr:M20/M25/M40 family metallo-hydrolase [Armatimonadota bacterium]MBS1710435.1 M20/M25/M40 family metallo-hydrolase [Armatimonadota bacterium]MBX3108106.1 M20/M25/M40 family metallo-hydrolase [Fimbriimonadaceae bacterium]
MNDLLALHRNLVSIPSVSHNEGEISEFIAAHLRRSGAEVSRHGLNVIAKTAGKPRLLLNTHFDTVPPNDAWTRDPWTADVVDGRVYGLGSNDAKGCAAAMLATFCSLHDVPGLAILLSPEEETGGQGTEVAWPYLRDDLGWRPKGVIVGEPTGLQIGVWQRGLLVLELVAEGIAGHAANTIPADNPVFKLARDISRLEQVGLTPHARFGAPTINPTVVSGSGAKNQVPAEARAILDIRTVPADDGFIETHEEITDLLRRTLESRVEIRSSRLKAFSCDPGSRIVQTVIDAVPGATPFASRTMSDQVWFEGFDAIKFGPGDSARSHTADEFIWESEVVAGYGAYRAVAQRFLA